MIKDEQWPAARLIPISSATGVEAQERRAASALLAVIGAVDEFGRALLKPLGAPAGKIDTFIEIPFKVNDRSVRPDGIITVSRGGKTWGAILEVKTASNDLQPEQIDLYLDLARELDFDAVLMLSNQYVTSSNELPVEIDKRKLRRVRIYHWSWVQLLTEAVVQKEHRGVSDRDQAYMLNELIRYLSDPRSGVVTFDDMGPSWVAVRDGAREKTLRKGDEKVDAVALRWDELVRYLCLDLTKELGFNVQQVLSSTERTPTARLLALKESLVSDGQLYGELRIPGAAGSLEIVVDLATRQVIASTRLDAPKEGRSKGRVSWLLRQLGNAPGQLKIEARLARSSSTLAASLSAVTDEPAALYPDSAKEIREFALSLTRDMGLKRDAGRGSFIDSVLTTARAFYGDVLQNLRPWKAQPPKLVPHPQPGEPREIAVTLPEKLEEAIEEAQDEMEDEASEAGTTQTKSDLEPDD
jgi:hypothetical protein